MLYCEERTSCSNCSNLVSQSTWARHSELASGHAQAQQLARAGIDWARAVLAEDQRISNLDHLGEPWAVRAAPVSVENGQIGGSIDDAQARFETWKQAVVLKDGHRGLGVQVRQRRAADALQQAKAAAGGMDVRIGGGVATVRQFLEADLIDTMHVAVSPIEIGKGERLWESPDELEDRFHHEAVPSPSGVTHHLFWRR